MSLSIKKLNKALSQIQRFTNTTKDMIYERVIKEIDTRGEGEQGEEGEIIRVFDVLEDGWFLKANIGTDSYGDNHFVRSIQIVRGQTKTVTVYEFSEEADTIIN